MESLRISGNFVSLDTPCVFINRPQYTSGIAGRILSQATWKDANLYLWIQYKYLLHLTASGINTVLHTHAHTHKISQIFPSMCQDSNFLLMVFYLWWEYPSSLYLSTLEDTGSYRYWHHLCRFLHWHSNDQGNRQCCSHSLSHWNLIQMKRNDYSLIKSHMRVHRLGNTVQVIQSFLKYTSITAYPVGV